MSWNFNAYTNRCFYLNHVNARLVGLTITNGAVTNDNGGGIYLAAGCVSNCVIVGNQAWLATGSSRGGGGVFITGGGEAIDCLISGNTVYTHPTADEAAGGGGVYVNNGKLSRTRLVYNVATNRNGSGGGVLIGGNSIATTAIVDRCDIISNVSYVGTVTGAKGGGGAFLGGGNGGGCFMSNCVITANTANDSGGGVVIYNGGIVRNCVIAANFLPGRTPGAGVAMFGTSANAHRIENCTIVTNRLTITGHGGLYINTYLGGVSISNVVNCIIYWNDGFGVQDDNGGNKTSLVNCCVMNANGTWPNPGGTTANPLLVSVASNDFRLSSAQSSCYNRGTNQAWMDNNVDLGGHSRKDRFSGIVDIGAYEFLPKGTLFKVR